MVDRYVRSDECDDGAAADPAIQQQQLQQRQRVLRRRQPESGTFSSSESRLVALLHPSAPVDAARRPLGLVVASRQSLDQLSVAQPAGPLRIPCNC